MLSLKALKLKRSKAIKNQKITYAALPREAYISAKQHKGKPSIVMVNVGQNIEENGLIAIADGAEGVNIHSSVPGEVVAISPQIKGNELITSIKIETGGNFVKHKKRENDLSSLDNKTLLAELKRLGVVDTITALPLHLKLNVSSVNKLVINLLEPDPYCFNGQFLLNEYLDELIKAIKIVTQLILTEQVIICTTKANLNKAIKIKELVEGHGELCVFNDSYLAANERLLKEKFGQSSLILHVTTLFTLYNALVYGEAHNRQLVSVGGAALTENAVMMVAIGTPLTFLFDECGGFKRKAARLVVGGAMSGYVAVTKEAAVTKDIHTVLALTAAEAAVRPTGECCHCYKCVANCPKKLIPYEMYKGITAGRLDLVNKMFLSECVSCGLCSYLCPARFDMAAAFKLATKLTRTN
ncbi:MAG: hypothetical protein FWE37_02135 [Spirochaetaceae bacterium]|nr:hypothetical protein [Spirochaetaceae bacterium]